MTSIFSLRCPICDGVLEPLHGAVWNCERCAIAFEVCGQVLVRVGSDGSIDDDRRSGHEPVDADGNTKSLDGSSATGQRSSIRSA
jgi:hypothetical protein